MSKGSPYLYRFMNSLATDIFSLDYDAQQHQLVGHWLRDSPDDDLHPSYEQLLAAAKAHGNCRFWLLDMRKRRWHSATFAKWFGDLLSRQAVRELGSPVFVAYVAEEAHRRHVESVATGVMLRQTAEVEFYPYFFTTEAAARDWLSYYQTHLEQQPALRQS